MNLWVPPTMDMEASRLALDAMAARFVTDTHPLTRELQGIDPLLELVKVGRPLGWPDDRDAPFGMRFGYWHLVRHNPDAPDRYIPVTGDDGEYVEPVSELVDWVRRQDQWDRRVQSLNDRLAEAETERRREGREFRADLREEAAERLKALESPGVRVKRAV